MICRPTWTFAAVLTALTMSTVPRGEARADVVFDNFDAGGGFHAQNNLVAARAVFAPITANRLAVRFQVSVSSPGFTLDSITLPISQQNTGGAGNFLRVRLASDIGDGTAPGATIEVLSLNQPMPQFANPFTATTTMNSVTHPRLTAGVRCWIVTELSALPAASVDFRWFFNTSGSTVLIRSQQQSGALPSDPWTGARLELLDCIPSQWNAAHRRRVLQPDDRSVWCGGDHNLSRVGNDRDRGLPDMYTQPVPAGLSGRLQRFWHRQRPGHFRLPRGVLCRVLTDVARQGSGKRLRGRRAIWRCTSRASRLERSGTRQKERKRFMKSASIVTLVLCLCALAARPAAGQMNLVSQFRSVSLGGSPCGSPSASAPGFGPFVQSVSVATGTAAQNSTLSAASIVGTGSTSPSGTGGGPCTGINGSSSLTVTFTVAQQVNYTFAFTASIVGCAEHVAQRTGHQRGLQLRHHGNNAPVVLRHVATGVVHGRRGGEWKPRSRHAYRMRVEHQPLRHVPARLVLRCERRVYDSRRPLLLGHGGGARQHVHSRSLSRRVLQPQGRPVPNDAQRGLRNARASVPRNWRRHARPRRAGPVPATSTASAGSVCKTYSTFSRRTLQGALDDKVRNKS